mmetsp:Transcript_5434/g.8415  ORF Transcript_5434/g.8415 Transcript_5434/m.8415 type:complete len:266 (+) Transcript_5434:174-971(+)
MVKQVSHRISTWLAKKFSKRYVACVKFNGVIVDQTPPRPNHLSVARYADCLDGAFAVNPQAVALKINCPGGSPVQSSFLYKRIKYLKKYYEELYSNEIPVIAFVEDMALSGGYYFACAADTIVADESSLVGSVGVIHQSFGLDKLAKKYDIERRVHTAGKFKSKFDPFLPENEHDNELMKVTLDELHHTFIRHVREGRGNRIIGSDGELFNGDFWAAESARQKGLVDEVSDFNTYCAKHFPDKLTGRVNSVDFKPRRTSALPFFF